MTKILSNLGRTIGNGFAYTATRKWCASTLDAAVKNPDGYAKAMVLVSIVSKDLVGCYYYTTQSLHNKKIPEEKRKFVASLDLMNGCIMVGGQILAGVYVEKMLGKTLFDKFIGKKLDNQVLKMHAPKAMEVAKKQHPNFAIENIEKELIKQYGSGSAKYKAMKGGFGLLLAFVATAAITKRIIAPLFATPLAGWFKRKFMDKGGKAPSAKNDAAPAKTTGDTYTPWTYAAGNKNDKTAFNKFTK